MHIPSIILQSSSQGELLVPHTAPGILEGAKRERHNLLVQKRPPFSYWHGLQTLQKRVAWREFFQFATTCFWDVERFELLNKRTVSVFNSFISPMKMMKQHTAYPVQKAPDRGHWPVSIRRTVCHDVHLWALFLGLSMSWLAAPFKNLNSEHAQ